ncbi:MAG TPA: MFS transporter [Thermoanaerobaculia bacterium]|jgi:UMF1 family MFS transporter|nr:MFS transporter [Thermoanaerobaculia bacterium]
MAASHPPVQTPLPPASRREIVSWAMFDFANSSYTTVIVSVAFGIYFTRLVAPEGRGDSLWGLAILLGNLLVLLLSPVVGAVADDSGRKKLFLAFTYATCVAGTALLWLVTPGRTVLGLGLFVLSFVGFSFGENLAAAFLPEISTPENVGRVSGFGWGLGYFGGLACLVVVMPLLKGGYRLENLGNLRLAWVATALFFLVAALPTFLFLRERAPRGSGTALEYVRAGFGRIASTAHSVRHFSELVRFLSVFFVYSLGLTSVIAFAGIFAERTLHFTSSEVIYLFIALQLTSAGGAFLFGFLQDRMGASRTIQITLVIWILVCVGVYFCQTKALFWWLALGAGLGIGSLQSASRGLVGLFSPPEKSGEFFGFWGLAGKGAYMLGPFIFGLISTATGSQRVAILSTALFFIAGLIGMAFVNEKRGQAEAASWNPSPPQPSSPDPPSPSLGEEGA